MFDVKPSTVLYWVRNFALKIDEKPTPKGDIVVELDEMLRFLKSKKPKYGFGGHAAALPVNWLTGNAEIEAQKP